MVALWLLSLTRNENFLDQQAFTSILKPTKMPDAVIRVYDAASNVIETHEHAGDFVEP